MNPDDHYRALERMYLAAPINAFYQPSITVSEAAATIRIAVKTEQFHAAGAVHGSVYFKMLDDAAFFAANSLEPETFVLTSSFTTYLTRPIVNGHITALGNVVHRSRSQFIAEAVARDDENRVIARGNGVFVRGSTPLSQAMGYAAEADA